MDKGKPAPVAPAKPEGLMALVESIVDQWFADHFMNNVIAGSPFYATIFDAKEDLKTRFAKEA